MKFIAACTTMEEKSRIMKAQKSMAHKGKKVFVDSDLTREEQEIQFEARKFAKQQAEGSKVATTSLSYNISFPQTITGDGHQLIEC